MDMLKSSTAEQQTAIAMFADYLRQNAEAAATLRQREYIIASFRERSVELVVRKCMDGRVHGSKGLGFPPTTVTFGRTDGNKADLSFNNNDFWHPLDTAAVRAGIRTPGMPALFISSSHRSTRGSGCAAHREEGDTKMQIDERALQCVLEQVKRVGSVYPSTEIYAVGAATDTDTMAKSLYFPDGTVFSPVHFAKTHALRQPSDLFSPMFLEEPLDDPAAHRSVGGHTPSRLLEGSDAPMYQNLQTAITMQDYLLRELSAVERAGSNRNRVLQTEIADSLLKTLRGIDAMPSSLRRIFLYMMVWNTAYSLYQEDRIAAMHENEREQHIEHAETIIGYGNGFQTLKRNSCLLVKPGSNNDERTLRVAKNVMASNRARNPQPHPPLVHINIEVEHPVSTWETFTDILARLRMKLRTVFSAFEDEPSVMVLTTYSDEHNKQFFPVNPRPGNPRIPFPVNLASNVDPQHLQATLLRRNEERYTLDMLRSTDPSTIGQNGERM